MYSKLFSSLVNSSLWSEPDHIRLLFITLLSLADRDGIVYGSRSGLERAAMIDPDAAEEINPWDSLMAPDNDSSDLMRNPENEGRRIEEIPGGFRLINYTYYKGIRDSEDRKAQNREAQRRFRNKISNGKPASAPASRRKPIESKIEIKKEEDDVCSTLSKPVKDKFAEWMVARRGMGKKPKSWDKMFAEQVKWLKQFSETDQIEVLSASIRGNWQGLFAPKNSQPVATKLPATWSDRKALKQTIDELQEKKNELFKMKQREGRQFTLNEQTKYDALAKRLEQLKAV